MERTKGKQITECIQSNYNYKRVILRSPYHLNTKKKQVQSNKQVISFRSARAHVQNSHIYFRPPPRNTLLYLAASPLLTP